MTLLLRFLLVVAGIAVATLVLKVLLELLTLCEASYLEKFRKAYWRILATSMIRIILVIYSVWVLASLFQSQKWGFMGGQASGWSYAGSVFSVDRLLHDPRHSPC